MPYERQEQADRSRQRGISGSGAGAGRAGRRGSGNLKPGDQGGYAAQKAALRPGGAASAALAPEPGRAVEEREDHMNRVVVPKLSAMGYEIEWQRPLVAGDHTLWWAASNPKVRWDLDAFERAASVLLAGNRQSITIGEVADLATRCAAWAASSYILPSEADLAARGDKAQHWYRGDPDPNPAMDGLIDAGRRSQAMSTMAKAMGVLITVMTATQLTALVLYGAGAAELGFAGWSMANRLALHGLDVGSALIVSVNPGSMGPGQQARFFGLLRDPLIVHRFFNECEPGVGYECRLGVLEALREVTA